MVTKPFEIVRTPRRPSRMSQESKLLLKALWGLGEKTSIRFQCHGHPEAVRTAKALLRFIYDARKSGKLIKKFSVLRCREDGSSGRTKPITKEDETAVWYVFVFVTRKSGSGRTN